MTHLLRSNRVMWGLLLVGLISYVLPWVRNPGAGLTVGAYDLAEWMSLHPASYQSPLPLFPSLLLRIHLVFFVVLLALTVSGKAPHERSWYAGLLTVGLVLAQLPPLEFFREINNPNYQQQFLLSVVSLLLGAIFLAGNFFHRWRDYIYGVVALGGVVTSVAGFGLAREYMTSFSLPAAAGIGFVLMLGCYTGVVLFVGTRLYRQTR